MTDWRFIQSLWVFFCVVLLLLMDFPCQIVFHWLHPRWACEVNPIHLGNFSRKMAHSGELKMNGKPFDKTGSPLVAWQWRHLRGAAVPLSSSTSAEARGCDAVCDWQPANNTARIQLDTDGARAFPAVTAHAQLIKTHFSVTKQLIFFIGYCKPSNIHWSDCNVSWGSLSSEEAVKSFILS